MIGMTVRFFHYNEAGEEVILTGVVEAEINEPGDPQPAYLVRADNGHFYTPDHSDCMKG